MEATELKEMTNALPYFLAHKTVWAHYDSEVDVLYLHFKKPNHADNSEMTEDEIIIRYENKDIIGMTILNASQRLQN
ncbi:MAG: DUF2283 domain-containing protein [Ignavibacteriales bacterium]|nr:DUF2283 domain-containing protein [Ignavibacteriales bacterium]